MKIMANPAFHTQWLPLVLAAAMAFVMVVHLVSASSGYVAVCLLVFCSVALTAFLFPFPALRRKAHVRAAAVRATGSHARLERPPRP